MTSDYCFDDGSLESKVLQFELIGQDVTVIKVKKYDKLDNWLVDVIEEDDEIRRCYLHFCYEDYVSSPIDIRADIAKALHTYPQLRIVCQYENADRASIKRRASNYGISLAVETDQIIQENKDKIKQIDYSKYSVGGESTVIGKSDPFKFKSEEFKNKRRRKKNET